MHSTSATPALPDEDIDRRWSLIDAAKDKITCRSGATLDWYPYSMSVTETVPCVVTGKPTSMCWEDGACGEALTEAVHSPDIAEGDLITVLLRLLAQTIVNADVHELAEHFRVDGVRVFDPHPGGRQFAAHVPIEVLLRWNDGSIPAPGLRHPDLSSGITRTSKSNPAGTLERLASELVERIEIGGPRAERFSARGTTVTHHAELPDRDHGDTREMIWIHRLGQRPGMPAGSEHELRAQIVLELFALAVTSACHEVGEWLKIDGMRIFDPHPEVDYDTYGDLPFAEHFVPVLHTRCSPWT